MDLYKVVLVLTEHISSKQIYLFMSPIFSVIFDMDLHKVFLVLTEHISSKQISCYLWIILSKFNVDNR